LGFVERGSLDELTYEELTFLGVAAEPQTELSLIAHKMGVPAACAAAVVDRLTRRYDLPRDAKPEDIVKAAKAAGWKGSQ
jgi:hypothetical protein